MTAPYRLEVRLAEPFHDDLVGGILIIHEPVADLGALRALLCERVPRFHAQRDEGYVFAVNGRLVLHDERRTPLQSGDEVELMLALSGG
jgi:molybdopterin converting factor small subunit